MKLKNPIDLSQNASALDSFVVKNLPLVSVVIPAYNAEGFINETLESILNQTWPRLEIIVVDDGSTDNTAEIVRSHGHRVYYVYQQNSGSCAVPRNVGMSRSLGEYICFLDADDLMLPERIANQVDFLLRHPDVGLVFSDYINFNKLGNEKLSHFATCPRLSFLMANESELVIEKATSLLADENFGIASSFMVRRQLINEVPGFDPTLRACEDFHFYYRLARVTKTGILSQVGMRRRIHDSNMSGDIVRMSEQGIRAYSDLLLSEVEPEARRFLKLYVSKYWMSLGRNNANQGRYSHSISCLWQALIVTPNFRCFCQTVYGAARTLSIALGVHHPNEK